VLSFDTWCVQLAAGKGTQAELQDTGLTSAQLQDLRSRLGQQRQAYLLPFLEGTVVKNGLHIAAPRYKELVFNLGSPAPACQLVPANVFAAVDEILQLGLVAWDLATDMHVKTWAPRLHHLVHTAIPKQNNGKLPDYALQLLRELRDVAEAAFKPHGEGAMTVLCPSPPLNLPFSHSN
jgi:hypothetical protein